MKIKKLIMAFFTIVVVITTFTLSAFALSPPRVTVGVYQTISSHFTESEARQVSQLVNYQYLSGSFAGLKPLLLRTSSSGDVILFLQDNRYSGYYTISGNTATLGGSSTVIRALLTSEGFAVQSNYSASATNYEANSVVAYADTNGLWQFNDTYAYGTTTGTTASAYGVWSSYYFSVVQYEINIEDARTEGYDEGYTVGQQAGYTTGYNNGVGVGYQSGLTDGYSNGYDEGYDIGFDDGVASVPPSQGGDITITETLDIGSIITAIPTGIKTIINDALDFEIFGINVAGTLTAILVVAIVGFVVKWLLSHKS